MVPPGLVLESLSHMYGLQPACFASGFGRECGVGVEKYALTTPMGMED